MTRPLQKPQAAALTDLLIGIFRTNIVTVTWADRLVAPLGLTTVRWQMPGAIIRAEEQQPVSWIARGQGASRQNVQRIVNDLWLAGLVAYHRNPHHKRAPLVDVTHKGRETYKAANALYNPLVEALADGLPVDDLHAAHRVMSSLRSKLEALAAAG